jgi:hypothetical protein
MPEKKIKEIPNLIKFSGRESAFQHIYIIQKN